MRNELTIHWGKNNKKASAALLLLAGLGADGINQRDLNRTKSSD